MATPSVTRIPRSAGGEWEFVRDSRQMIRYRKVGDMAWSYLTPTEVATLNALRFE